MKKELPILFKTEMVRATLADRKTQTRRLNGLEDVNGYEGLLTGDSGLGPLGYCGLMKSTLYLKHSLRGIYKKYPGKFHWFLGEKTDHKEINPIPVRCPYGAVGDVLWCRETWAVAPNRLGNPSLYRRANPDDEEWFKLKGYKWQPSIFMPKQYCRLKLEITGIRAERLQDITAKDCGQEGISSQTAAEWIRKNPFKALGSSPLGNLLGSVETFKKTLQQGLDNSFIGAYSELWDSINGKSAYPWASNPYVWVVEFRRIRR